MARFKFEPLSLVARLCHPLWLSCPPKTAKWPWHQTHLCYGVPSQGQVWAGRCVGPTGAHFHSSAPTLATPSSPDPENSSRRSEPEASPLQCPQALKSQLRTAMERKQPITQQEAVDSMVATLQDLFGMKEQDALEVLIACLPTQASYKAILHNLHSLKECRIPGSQIQRIPWIMTQHSGQLSNKLIKLREPYMFKEYSDGLGLCFLSLERISYYQKRFRREAANFSGHPNRVYYLAERIQVPVDVLSERISKPHRTLTMDIKRLDIIIDILHRYGITPEDIVADLWVFGYCAKRAEDRLRRVSKLGCTELKPWMCRCSDKIFDRFCERYQCGRDLLGDHDSVFDFLSERLDCNRSEVEQAFQSNIVMQRVHISKFNRILDLLFSEGIPAQEIRMCMRIFQFSEVRTAARIQELKDIGYFPFPLNILCRTPARFRTLVQEFKKRKYSTSAQCSDVEE